METEVLNIKGETVGKCELPEVLFGAKPEPHFLYEFVTAYLANQRSGTACVKTRGEVSGGGRKPYKQKGTGRARQGSTRSPIWRKGGVAFGPRPHSHRRELPATKRHLALTQALSAAFSGNKLTVIDGLKLKKAKTGELSAILGKLSSGNKPLLVSMRTDKNIELAGRNIDGLNHCKPADLNAYLVLNSSKIVITKDALENMGSLWKEGSAK